MNTCDEFSLEAIVYERLIEEADILFKELFPICRSITGEGVRKTLVKLKEIADFEIKHIPSGTVCYDWVVPDEWNISEAWVKNPKGEKVIDFGENNLHVVNYSIEVSPFSKSFRFGCAIPRNYCSQNKKSWHEM
ncbi:MAG: DUF4910 domain-containing protein [Candidatus Methanoperedenaceae archaeon]|nr:DUF4910 domain-containing protein [Candidatus Methanoperedenaceae archaeon]